jgi:hypothetical protein
MNKTDVIPRDYGVWPIEDNTKFPTGFFDIGDLTFLEVYNTKKEFVDFIKLVDDATGLFGSFQNYCLGRD